MYLSPIEFAFLHKFPRQRFSELSELFYEALSHSIRYPISLAQDCCKADWKLSPRFVLLLATRSTPGVKTKGNLGAGGVSRRVIGRRHCILTIN